MHKKVIILADTRKKDVQDCLQEVQPWLEKKVEILGWYRSSEEIEKEKLQQTDYLILFGGDGLFLGAARCSAPFSVPILGVNFGKLGFLTEFSIEEFFEKIPEILNGKGKIQSRMMLECEIEREGEKIHKHLAVNEVSIKESYGCRMLYISLSVNNEQITSYGGDGVIVATPIGSTAYSLSAGGPVVSPDLSAFIITPVCPHLLNLRPLVVSSENSIQIHFLEPFPDGMVLNIDGQIHFPLQRYDKISIHKSSEKFYMLTMEDRSFFRILQEKLAWGEGKVKIFKNTKRYEPEDVLIGERL